MAVIHKSTTSAGEDAEGRGTSCAVDGNAHSGKEYGVSPQIKNGTALWPSNSSSGNVTEETESTDLKEYMNPSVHNSIIYNSQVLETA